MLKYDVSVALADAARRNYKLLVLQTQHLTTDDSGHREPFSTRKNKSRPLRSVPKACSGEGGRKLWAVTSLLSADSRMGPTRAAMATPTTINVETIIAGFRRSLLQAERESVIQNDSAIKDTI